MTLKYLEVIRVLLVLLAAIVCMPVFAQDKGVVVDRIIAKVDDKIILQSELEEAYLQFLSSGQVTAGTSKCNIFESLVVNKLLVAKAEIDSVLVLDVEVDQNLDQRMQMILSQVGGNEQALESYYGKSLVDIRNELRESVKEQLIVQRMQSSITSDISVTPAEVQAFFNRIPRDSLPYFSAEVSIGQMVKIPEVGKDVKDRVRNQLLEYKKRIEAGESFEALARQYSQGPSAPKGGNLGYQQRGSLVPPYEAAALQLEPGEISDPVESEFGFHLIQLISRRGNEYDSRHILLELEPSLKDIEKAEVYLDSLRTLIVKDSIAFEKVAKEYSDEQITADNGGFMIGETGSPYVATDKLDFETFLTLDTMKLGTITHPLPYQTQDGKKAVRIIYYKDRIKPHQANLLDDYQKIANATLAEKKNRILNSWFDKARNDVFIQIDPEYNNCQILQ
ncbi:MAG: peptidylprolyl isomerase [Cyclobacteriaceae bacterium]|nr:MAG: peptidylprolyl isomerase [Cyclobacteriaceae bacterium]